MPDEGAPTRDPLVTAPARDPGADGLTMDVATPDRPRSSRAPRHRPLRAGRLVAPGYRVLDHLHRGHVLDVYDVWSEARACRCVAKLLRLDRLDEPADRRRLIQEGRLLQRLAHPHIVRAYETLQNPSPVVILETLPGATLGRLIEHRGPLTVADVALVGLHLSSAMHYLHGQGFLHLDLKPSNIVVNGGMAKVIDLSIAQRPGRGRRGVGTRQYMSPEQAAGGRVSSASDVWAIGVILFEAATKQCPFEALDGRRYDQLERRADPIRAHRRLPRAVSTLVDACLDLDPAQRPAVDDLLTVLARQL